MWPRPGSWAGWGPARCTWAGCSTAITPCAAEEVFFRGALYAAAGGRHPVALSTTVYSLATTATRNPALVLASAAMGTLLGLQRRATGGIQAPILTHLTWSTLMLHFLPPLFRGHPATRPPHTWGSTWTSRSEDRS